MSFAAHLAEKGITLPKVSTPVGNYVSILKTGNMLYLCLFFFHCSSWIAGALPIKEDGSMYKGKVNSSIVTNE